MFSSKYLIYFERYSASKNVIWLISIWSTQHFAHLDESRNLPDKEFIFINIFDILRCNCEKSLSVRTFLVFLLWSVIYFEVIFETIDRIVKTLSKIQAFFKKKPWHFRMTLIMAFVYNSIFSKGNVFDHWFLKQNEAYLSQNCCLML